MKSLHDSVCREEILARIERLSPDAPARWGKMTAPRVVVHLADSLRMATGDLEVASKKLPIRFTPLKQIIVYLAPFPKGAPTAPELIRRTPTEWRKDVDELRAAVARFGEFSPADKWPDHPAFGTLGRHGWGVLTYRHTDHHLRQFGA